MGGLVLALSPAAAIAQRGGPDVTNPLAVSGVAHVGQQLTATWRGRPPHTVTYYWLRCGNESWYSCDPIDAQHQSVYTITSGDVGWRLRVLVHVRDDDDDDDWAWSELTSAVTLPPPAPPPPPPVVVPQPAPAAPAATLMRPRPLVRIRGWLTPGGAKLTRLSVRAPRGASISVRCFGRGCPRERLARTAKLTRLKAFETRMRAGTRIVIRVRRAGFIGKYTSIRIRRGKQPARRDLCLFPGTRKPKRCPAG